MHGIFEDYEKNAYNMQIVLCKIKFSQNKIFTKSCFYFIFNFLCFPAPKSLEFSSPKIELLEEHVRPSYESLYGYLMKKENFA